MDLSFKYIQFKHMYLRITINSLNNFRLLLAKYVCHMEMFSSYFVNLYPNTVFCTRHAACYAMQLQGYCILYNEVMLQSNRPQHFDWAYDFNVASFWLFAEGLERIF